MATFAFSGHGAPSLVSKLMLQTQDKTKAKYKNLRENGNGRIPVWGNANKIGRRIGAIGRSRDSFIISCERSAIIRGSGNGSNSDRNLREAVELKGPNLDSSLETDFENGVLGVGKASPHTQISPLSWSFRTLWLPKSSLSG
jgi:hypothetical protein